MDLTERGESATRHPWEVQRFQAYRGVLSDHDALGARRVLDVGAGDGWFTDVLAEALPDDAVTECWDVNYDDNELEPARPGQLRTRHRPAGGHDLVLVLDVLEHIEEPSVFIVDELMPITEPGTPVLVAVPAYQWLFGDHDVALGHHRRYGRQELLEQVDPWIDLLEYGSLFASLLVPRAAAVAFERFRPQATSNHGIGDWSHGRFVTMAVGGALALDVRIGRSLGRVGLRLPGLSHWAYGVVR